MTFNIYLYFIFYLYLSNDLKSFVELEKRLCNLSGKTIMLK